MKQKYYKLRDRTTGKLSSRVFKRIGDLKNSISNNRNILNTYEVVELEYTVKKVPDSIFEKYMSNQKINELNTERLANQQTNHLRIMNVLKWFSDDLTKNFQTATNLSTKDVCFVFGANAAGIHGAGAAYDARTEWNAQLYEVHRTGDAYGLVTVDKEIKNPVSEEEFLEELELLRYQMKLEPNTTFLISKVGTGLAGLDPVFVETSLKEALKGLKNFIGPEGWGLYP